MRFRVYALSWNVNNVPSPPATVKESRYLSGFWLKTPPGTSWGRRQGSSLDTGCCALLCYSLPWMILVLYFNRDVPSQQQAFAKRVSSFREGGNFSNKNDNFSCNSHNPYIEASDQPQLVGFSPNHTFCLSRSLALMGFHHVVSINGCTLPYEFVTLINTGYLSVSNVFIRN